VGDRHGLGEKVTFNRRVSRREHGRALQTLLGPLKPGCPCPDCVWCIPDIDHMVCLFSDGLSPEGGWSKGFGRLFLGPNQRDVRCACKKVAEGFLGEPELTFSRCSLDPVALPHIKEGKGTNRPWKTAG
jgi:hypothetical protein